MSVPHPKTIESGDRVWLLLAPDQRRLTECRYYGSVISVNDPALPRPGIVIALDEPCRGIRDCFATHAEVHPAALDSVEAPKCSECGGTGYQPGAAWQGKPCPTCDSVEAPK